MTAGFSFAFPFPLPLLLACEAGLASPASLFTLLISVLASGSALILRLEDDPLAVVLEPLRRASSSRSRVAILS